jgi:hypothetical protein
MMFILGLIVGLILGFGCSLGILVIETKLPASRKVVYRIQQAVPRIHAAIIDTDDETLARDELIEENDRNGQDTELESII